MKKLAMICMAFLAVACMVSCRGPQGPMGPVGPMGPAGNDGNDGNANVVSSTVNVRTSDWYWDKTSWRVDLNYPAINADIDNYGAVLVYMDNGGTWRQLPFTFYYSDLVNGQEVFCSSSLEISTYVNGVSIFWTENDFYDGYQPDDHVFKIVVIAASMYNARQDVDYSSYEAVKTAFQLAD